MSNVTTGSLNRQGTTAQTESVISSRFKIFSNVVGVGKFVRMGVTSSFGISESKQVEAIRGLGYGDQVLELVPGVTEAMRLQVTRTALYLASIQQMFGYRAGVSGAVRSLKHHRWPFDLKTELVFSQIASEDVNLQNATKAQMNAEGGINNLGNTTPLYCVATIFTGCWMNDYSTTYTAEQAAVTEECSITVTDVIDISGTVYGEFLDSGNNSSDVTGRSLIFGESNAVESFT